MQMTKAEAIQDAFNTITEIRSDLGRVRAQYPGHVDNELYRIDCYPLCRLEDLLRHIKECGWQRILESHYDFQDSFLIIFLPL